LSWDNVLETPDWKTTGASEWLVWVRLFDQYLLGTSTSQRKGVEKYLQKSHSQQCHQTLLIYWSIVYK
jgi:hypothetical protein